MRLLSRFVATPLARLLVFVAASTSLACGGASAITGDGLTEATGVPGHVLFVSIAYAGGQRTVDSLLVDSTSGRWRRSECGPTSASSACTVNEVRLDSGTVMASFTAPLFERARRSDFRAMRRNYPREGVVPPDVVTYTLHVVQNGIRQIVSWEGGATRPVAVDGFLCRLEQARGGFVLCSD